ncbi:MAG TPA: hypothetical protein VEI83_09945 [Acidimicrobiales bacterium]|nr:hypothetical protein [Acidimicrobiales bacterium]
MPFIQIIEYKTSKPDEVNAVFEEFFAATEGRRSGHGYACRDRDRDDTYVNVVVFPSYQEAMANSELPETRAMADKLVALCDGQPSFTNLDVLRTDGGS